jgi:hypothetical protein
MYGLVDSRANEHNQPLLQCLIASTTKSRCYGKHLGAGWLAAQTAVGVTFITTKAAIGVALIRYSSLESITEGDENISLLVLASE